MKLTGFLRMAVCAAIGISGSLHAQVSENEKMILPVPSKLPSAAQRQQIDRRYGMFIHFGINTFHNEEWTDGSKPASSYCPTSVDADQWIRTARNAGMRYVILVAKHHEGFCLWDSRYTEYDVARSGNPTNVIEAVAKACKKYHIDLGLYYSLWDRKENADVKNISSDEAYNNYMIHQLNELMDIVQPYTSIVEFWFDGSWMKENTRWPIERIYQTIKSRMPDCQIGINWPIGKPDAPDQPAYPQEQQEGDPIRYFPSDFRLGDPYLPRLDDPKVFSHAGKEYYMPWESTVCLSGRWFYHTDDHQYKTLDELTDLYNRCTRNDNILILNFPPNREGRMRKADVKLLKQLRKRLAASAATARKLEGVWTQPIPGQPNQTCGIELKADGKASSLNSHTLVYGNWLLLSGNRLVLAGQSIGNRQTVSFSDTLDIEKLTSHQLILKKGDYVSSYSR